MLVVKRKYYLRLKAGREALNLRILVRVQGIVQWYEGFALCKKFLPCARRMETIPDIHQSFTGSAITNNMGTPIPKEKDKKVKKKSISFYKKKLDSVFSKYIRARDKHICYTCDRRMESNQSQNGHFVPRQYMATRYHEKNCHAQCYACNMLYNGQPSAYAQRLKNDYGEHIIDELERNRHEVFKVDVSWYLTEIARYEEELKSLS